MTKVTVIRPYATLPSEGGSNDRYVHLCKKLIGQGAQVELLCSDFIHNAKKRRTRIDQETNLRDLPFLVHLRTFSYASNLSLARIAHEVLFGVSALFYLMRNPRPDVAVVGEPLFGVGWLIILYGFLFRVPVLADVIDLWPEADTDADIGMVRQMAYGFLKSSRHLRLRYYRAVSFVSHSYADRLGFKGNPVFYWGSELIPDKPRQASGDKLQVIYAGSFGVGYDITTVLETARRLKREMPQRFHISFAGSGPQLPEVKHAHADGTLEYLGVLDRQSLIHQYETADIGLLPYKPGSMVAMPIKFFDYLNFGLYTLTSLGLEAGQIVMRQKVGDMYRAGDLDDLFQKLKKLDAGREGVARARETAGALAKAFAVDEQYGRFARYILDHAGSR